MGIVVQRAVDVGAGIGWPATGETWAVIGNWVYGGASGGFALHEIPSPRLPEAAAACSRGNFVAVMPCGA